MKNPVESSVMSHSQSDASSQRGKSQLLHGTTTKLDAFFPFLDQICLKSHVPKIFYYLSTIYLYYQVFFSSLYPFNKFWFTINDDRSKYIANSKIVKINTILENIAWFFHVEDEHLDSKQGRTNGETNLLPPAIIMIIIFIISLFNLLIQMFGLTRLHKLRKINFYLIRFIFDILSPIMIIPTSALLGISIRNLVISGDKLNWIYMFCGAIMYIIFVIYTYIGLIILNQSTCISMTFLSSFNIRIPLFLPVIASFFVILQCIFSLFYYWAMVIVQVSHIAISILAFYSLIYLIFHTKIANILFIGVILSTCFNDLIFSLLHFIPSPSKSGENSIHEKIYFYYISGYIFPLIFLIISFVISTFYVNWSLKKILNELNQLSDQEDSKLDISNNNNNDNNFDFNSQKFSPLANHKLFQNEKLALMSVHISFFNCLPIFYKWTALSYVVAQIQTTDILIASVQYLSFFPGASRKLNTFLSIISQNRGLSYHQRFLLYQIFKIKTMRQSSSSADANRKLAELKAITTQNYEDIVSFFQLKISNVNYLEMISNENWTVDGKWEEAVRDFPNFQKFSDEYCSFLIECEMNLPRALVMKHRSNLIEMGRNFIVDVPFISLAKSVPAYLKKGIVDFQGSFKRQKDLTASGAYGSTGNNRINSNNNIQTINSSSTGSAGSTGSTGMFSSASSMLTDGYNLDPEFEESLGHQLFKQTPLRLEMYHSLANRKSYASLLILIYSFFILVGGISLLLGIYLYIDGYIIERSDSMYYLNLASKIRFYLDLSVLGSTLKFAYHTGRFTSLSEFNKLDLKDDIDNYKYSSGYNADIFKIDDQISSTLIHSNLVVSKNALSQLIIHLALLSFDGEPVYDLAHIFMYNEVPFTMCINGNPDYKVPLSLKTLIAYMHFLVDQTSSKEAKEGYWFNTDDVCEILSNQPEIESSTLTLFSTLMNHEIDLCDKEDKFILVFSSIFPFIPLILYIVPPLIFTHLFIKDANKVVKILLGVNQDAKEQAKKPVRKDSIVEYGQASERKPKSKQWILLKIGLFIFSIATTLLVYFLLSETKELNNDVKKLGRWNLLSSIRMSCSVVSMNYMLTAVILNSSSSLNLSKSDKAIATRENMIKFCRETLVQLENSNEVLLKGSEVIIPSSGFDKRLDEINVDAKCEIKNNNTDLHDSYRCASGSQGVNIFISMINVVLDDIEKTGGNFNHEMIYHSLHLLNRHLLSELEEAVDRIHEINVILCKELENKSLIIFICAVITTILTFVLLLLFYAKSVSIYRFAMVLIQRLPPSAFLSDKKLLNFILNKKDNKKESDMSTSQSVIYMSHDAIVCTNNSGVVEIINPAVTNILGYTPDQMLGQHISTFFANNKNVEQKQNIKKENNTNPDMTSTVNIENMPASDAEKLTNQLELMINGQSGLVYEGHFICLTDDDKEMPCGLTILGMTGKKHSNNDNNSDDSDYEFNHETIVESFVFIIRDETQLIQQQNEAEIAKARSENLLFHILPRDIVTRLNSGEKDISFTVESASIIFTDVVKFSEYALNLSPQEIMGSLSTLFEAFDSYAKNYELITKIKLIGDIYMAAAGLFSPDIAPKDHAEQILNFGIDCLNELEDVNLKLNASLQLRVGINSGGPVLAGVLGTDKPVFDIIGDPINVAARLQTTDVPGKIQIPKATYDLVCNGDFSIEERGEVFLKGKGKTISYLVTPRSQNNVGLVAISSQKLE